MSWFRNHWKERYDEAYKAVLKWQDTYRELAVERDKVIAENRDLKTTNQRLACDVFELRSVMVGAAEALGGVKARLAIGGCRANSTSLKEPT